MRNMVRRHRVAKVDQWRGHHGIGGSKRLLPIRNKTLKEDGDNLTSYI